MCLSYADSKIKGYLYLFLGAALYLLLNWSYTTCAFTDPGSPLNSPDEGPRQQYSHLPTHEPTSLTVKSDGSVRFCKKCQCRKPDRAHHCSTCGRCVLKMDHHCPWLATCVGLKNYKSFILFLSYTTLFCYVCFGVSVTGVWTEIASEEFLRGGGFLGVNIVLLAVLSGIIGLVLTGFTGWHISLAFRNLTTIECLEKTRYSSPIKKTLKKVSEMGNGEDASLMQRYGQQLAEIHANAIPGVTRNEEGEESLSNSSDPNASMTAMDALNMNYNEIEAERERARYEAYLDEKDSERLPNAFDLGWRRNLYLLFGDNKLLWFFPVCNTIGDGWHWDANPLWISKRESLRQEREEIWRQQGRREEAAGWTYTQDRQRYMPPSTRGVQRAGNKADRVLGRLSGQYADEGFNDQRPGSEMSMKTFRRRGQDDDASSLDGLYDNEDAYEVSSDEQGNSGASRQQQQQQQHSADQDEWRDWD
jgi:palmitoyltransferase ZDHHC2/15/20